MLSSLLHVITPSYNDGYKTSGLFLVNGTQIFYDLLNNKFFICLLSSFHDIDKDKISTYGINFNDLINPEYYSDGL